MKESCRNRTRVNQAQAIWFRPVQGHSAGRLPRLLRHTGVLQSIDADALSLTPRHGRKRIPVVFHWDQFTQFQEKGRAITPDDLRQGERVSILYIKRDSGLVAQAVLVPNHPDARSKHTAPTHDRG